MGRIEEGKEVMCIIRRIGLQLVVLLFVWIQMEQAKRNTKGSKSVIVM